MEPLVAEIERRFAELEAQLGDPAVLADQRRYAAVAREHKRLSAAAELARQWRERTAQVADAAELARRRRRGDARVRAGADRARRGRRCPALEEEIRLAMLERDPADDKDVIVELRAGTGGDEAAIFAGNLYEMLTRYAEQRGFKTDTLATSGGDAGGFKELVFEIKGDGAYSVFKHESGVHRVQRVPATESQGRIHTSTATVAVLPEAEDVELPRRPERPAHRRLPGRRPRRPVGEHDRLGGAHHPHPDRHGRHLPGRALAAPEQGAGDEDPARAPLRAGARAAAREEAADPARPRSAPASARRRSAPTTTRRTASPTTASGSPCTT